MKPDELALLYTLTKKLGEELRAIRERMHMIQAGLSQLQAVFSKVTYETCKHGNVDTTGICLECGAQVHPTQSCPDYS